MEQSRINFQAALNSELLDGKYLMEELLGQGGMGAVYRAIHAGTKRTVAIKVIHPRLANNAEFVERFRREAEATGRLRHPNVVDVTDFGFAQTSLGRVAYLVMEYLDGCTLADILDEEKRLPRDWVIDILDQVCSAAHEAHRFGIIHRDLKPDNIWLQPNRRGGYTVKVLDFGLAKVPVSPISRVELVRRANLIESGPASPAPGIPDTTGMVRSGSASDPESATLIQSQSLDDAGLVRAVLPQNQPLISPLVPSRMPLLQSGVSDSSEQAAKPTASPSNRQGPETATNEARPTGPSYADLTADGAGLTRLGSVMGTPLYMSPEQCRGEPLDARSDIYSLGVIAYRMLAGETPFTGGLPELIRLHETAAPPSLRGRNRKVPRKMARVIMSALAKDPAGRPESAAALAAALRATGEGIGVLVRQSVSLYSEQFPALLKVSLLGYLPLLAILLVNYLSGRLIPWQGLSQPVATIAGLVLGVLLPMLGHFLSYFIVSGAAVPIVVQLMAAPLSHISIRTAMGRLKRRWWAFFKTSLAVVLIVVAGTALFFVLAFIAASSTSMFAIVIALAGTVLCLIPMMAAAAYYSLYAPVVVMEGLGVWATLRRASTLMKRTWTPVVMITILQFALPILELALGNNLNLRISTTEVNFSFHFSNDASSILPQMLNVLITPLTTVMAALLYLKTRQAGGETINEVIETLDQPEFLGGKWQARMRGPSRPA